MSNEENETSIEDLKKSLSDRDATIKDLQTQFDAVKGKADQLLDETKKAKAKARDDEAIANQALKDRAKKNGDFEQLLQSSEKERQALSEQLGTLQNRVSSEKTRSESLRLASELADGTNAELLSEFISKRLKYTEDGLKVLDDNGNLTVSSLQDLKHEFESSGKFQSLIRGSKSSGGGAVGDGNGVAGKAKIERSNFDGMNPTQQMEFIRDGGEITD